MTPERVYVRQWALALLEKVLRDLEKEQGVKGKSALFAELRPFLIAGSHAASKAAAAERMALHRLRRRYQARLEAAILETVSDPEDVGREIRHLMAALG